MIYKVLRAEEWKALETAGETPGAPIDIADGFVHFSTAAQLRGTLDKHFAGLDGLVLLSFDPDAMGPALKWEPSRGGDLFPHFYGPLRLSDVVSSRPIPLRPEGHLLPDDMA